MSPGPLALVVSGEYLPVMAGVERLLLAGRPPRYVQIPTDDAPEGGRHNGAANRRGDPLGPG